MEASVDAGFLAAWCPECKALVKLPHVQVRPLCGPVEDRLDQEPGAIATSLADGAP